MTVGISSCTSRDWLRSSPALDLHWACRSLRPVLPSKVTCKAASLGAIAYLPRDPSFACCSYALPDWREQQKGVKRTISSAAPFSFQFNKATTYPSELSRRRQRRRTSCTCQLAFHECRISHPSSTVLAIKSGFFLEQTGNRTFRVDSFNLAAQSCCQSSPESTSKVGSPRGNCRLWAVQLVHYLAPKKDRNPYRVLSPLLQAQSSYSSRIRCIIRVTDFPRPGWPFLVAPPRRQIVFFCTPEGV